MYIAFLDEFHDFLNTLYVLTFLASLKDYHRPVTGIGSIPS
jgi:hypothetical protein